MQRFFWLIIIVFVILRIFIFFWLRDDYPDGTHLRIFDRVMSEPIRYDNAQRITLQGFSFYLPLYPEVNYGDRIVVEGVVEDKKLKQPQLVDDKKDSHLIFNFRNRVIDFYQRSLPSKHSSLVAGVTLGSKKNISTDFWESLKLTGTAHVVVASGMNVTLVAGFLIKSLVVFVRRRKAIFITLIGVWVYVIMSGFDAPIIRAAIMGSIAFSAQEIGRIYYAGRALIISALCMLLVKPEWIGDLGFILSFVATGSLMLFEGKFRKRLGFVPKILRQDLSTTLAAQLGVAPILFVTFGQFNVLSPFINVLVLWTVPFITIIGMFSGFVGIVTEPIGRLLLLLTYPFSAWFIAVIGLFG